VCKESTARDSRTWSRTNRSEGLAQKIQVVEIDESVRSPADYLACNNNVSGPDAPGEQGLVEATPLSLYVGRSSPEKMLNMAYAFAFIGYQQSTRVLAKLTHLDLSSA
jgi:hypothetical protein